MTAWETIFHPIISRACARAASTAGPGIISARTKIPTISSARPDLKNEVIVPDILIQPHSASMQMMFYTGEQFPAEYKGNIFAAEHGSWNRAKRTGYKIIRGIVKDGVPSGAYEDFVTGFAIDDARVWGRPVGIAQAKDGSLLFSDDGNGTIWRVSYVGHSSH